MSAFAMVGAGGRMGRTIIRLSRDFTDRRGEPLTLSGALERADSPLAGQDAGTLAGGPALGVLVSGDAEHALRGARVAIDFSAPESTLAVAKVCRRLGVGLVVGSTGLSPAEKRELEAAAADIPLLIAPNMSLGVNVLFHLTAIAAEALASGYDVEVTEAHHHHKKDAPSGTAVRLKEILLETLGRSEQDVSYGRSGMPGARPPREIGVHALRGGDVVGDHTVFFFGEGERIELTHRATSRETFARGALNAGAFIASAAPGLYSMRDVLGV